jgi:hypothetical protein
MKAGMKHASLSVYCAKMCGIFVQWQDKQPKIVVKWVLSLDENLMEKSELHELSPSDRRNGGVGTANEFE